MHNICRLFVERLLQHFASVIINEMATPDMRAMCKCCVCATLQKCKKDPSYLDSQQSDVALINRPATIDNRSIIKFFLNCEYFISFCLGLCETLTAKVGFIVLLFCGKHCKSDPDVKTVHEINQAGKEPGDYHCSVNSAWIVSSLRDISVGLWGSLITCLRHRCIISIQ